MSINFEGVCPKLEPINFFQSSSKYLAKAPVFMWSITLWEKVQFLFFRRFLLVATKVGGLSIWEYIYKSLKFSWYFVISWNPRFHFVLQLVRQLVYTSLLPIITLGKEDFFNYQKLWKYYEHGYRLTWIWHHFCILHLN